MVMESAPRPPQPIPVLGYACAPRPVRERTLASPRSRARVDLARFDGRTGPPVCTRQSGSSAVDARWSVDKARADSRAVRGTKCLDANGEAVSEAASRNRARDDRSGASRNGGSRLGRAWCGAGLCCGGSSATSASELLVLTSNSTASRTENSSASELLVLIDTIHTETPTNPTRDEPRLTNR